MAIITNSLKLIESRSTDLSQKLGNCDHSDEFYSFSNAVRTPVRVSASIIFCNHTQYVWVSALKAMNTIAQVSKSRSQLAFSFVFVAETSLPVVCQCALILLYSYFIDIHRADIQRHSSWAFMCIGSGSLTVSLIGPLNDGALIQKQLFFILCNLLEDLRIAFWMTDFFLMVILKFKCLSLFSPSANLFSFCPLHLFLKDFILISHMQQQQQQTLLFL